MELRTLSSLELWPENYRLGNVEAIMRSIARFGFNGAVRVRGNVVYAGNHQVIALRRLKVETGLRPRGVEADPSGDWLVPVIAIDHLSESEATAFAIADNRTQELGSVSDEALANLLAELDATSDLVSATGYSDLDLSKLMPDLTPKGAKDDRQPALDHEDGIVECPSCGEVFKP